MSYASFHSALKARTSQPIAGLKSTCPRRDVNDHLDSLEVTCVQHVGYPSCWFSNPGYCQKAMVIQILQYIGLALIHAMAENPSPIAD